MTQNILLLFGSIMLISLVSLVGVFTLSIKKEILTKYLDALVALAVGAMLGGAFLHLLPELAEKGLSRELSATILAGIVLFFIAERFVEWHHCHKAEHNEMSFTYMNLIGDSVHNMLDGIILAGAFLSGAGLGIITTIAVFLHEVPQEIGDFGVLIKGGFSRKKALFSNFLVALTSFLGAGLALFFNATVSGAVPYMIALAIGGFVYIAGTDLIPALGKCASPKESLCQLAFILLGVGAMTLILFI